MASKKEKTVWVVSEFYYPNSESTGYFLTKIAEKLGDSYKVEVLCATSHHKDGKYQKREEINQVLVHRIGKDSLNKNRLSSRILRFVLVSLRMFSFLLLHVNKGDVLFVVTNPAPIIIVSAIIKKFKRSKLIILVHDVFPENLDATGLLYGSNLLYKASLRVFNWAYACSDDLITLGRDMSAVFDSKLNQYHGKITYIPNWTDPKSIYPIEERLQNWKSEYNLMGKLIFQFAGNLGRAQGVSYMLEAAEKFPENTCILFFGNGFFQQKVADLSIECSSIYYGGTFIRSESLDYLNRCDVAIISLEAGMTGLGVPSKTYNILAAGKPIMYIGEVHSEVGRLVQEEGIGYICKPGDAGSIVKGVEYFLNLTEDKLVEMSRKSRKLAEEKFSVDEILEKYKDLISSRMLSIN